MNEHTIYIPDPTPALFCAARKLVKNGFTLVASATDAETILLPVPTPVDLDYSMYRGKQVIGGNLSDRSKTAIDLLQDDTYLAKNAAITAEAALGLILPKLCATFADSPILILGWGRIGKTLVKKLQQLGVPVTVYARKSTDQAMLQALGCDLYAPEKLPQYQCIVNTATAPILSQSDMTYVNPACYLLELASKQYLPGENVVHGRGLPGRCKPEASGSLIAETVSRYLKGDR